MSLGRTCTICREREQLPNAVRCAQCQGVFNALRVSDQTITGNDKRRVPTAERLRAAVIEGYIPKPTVTLKSAGHNGKREPLPRTEEVEHALGVLRDAQAQRENRQGYVYLIIEATGDQSLKWGKIGYSTNPAARVAELQEGNPRRLKLHLMKPGTLEDEAALHAKYIDCNVLQEWFTIDKNLLLEWGPEHYVERIEA